MKPCGRAQGRGIFLLDKLSQVGISACKLPADSMYGCQPHVTFLHHPKLLEVAADLMSCLHVKQPNTQTALSLCHFGEHMLL